MKKLLSLIGAISLVTLSGTSVISCVIKQEQTKPQFQEMFSLTPSLWNNQKREFVASEIVADNAEHEITSDSYLLYTIASMFKNPNDVLEYFTNSGKGPITYKGSKPVGSESKTTTFLTIKNATNYQIKGLTTEIISEKNRLKVDPQAPLSLTLNKTDSNKIYQALREAFGRYKIVKDTNGPDKFIDDAVMLNLDIIIKNTGIAGLEKEYLPGYNEETKLLYPSLGQQLSFLSEGYSEMNQAIMPVFENMVKAGSDGHDIEQNFSEVKLGTLTIKLVS